MIEWFLKQEGIYCFDSGVKMLFNDKGLLDRKGYKSVEYVYWRL